MGNDFSRRDLLLKTASLAAAAPFTSLLSASPTARVVGEPVVPQSGPFALPELPYAYDALTAAIDEETMRIHHTAHHQGYVTKLNEAMIKAMTMDATSAAQWRSNSIDHILKNLQHVPNSIRTDIRNNGGGHSNHSIFWSIMSPDGGGEPTGRIKQVIDRDFGGFNAFKATFEGTGGNRFGSGWIWLVRNPDKRYAIISRPNQDSPIIEGRFPVLGNDVWEHAYYLRYQNKRVDYLKAWWNVVNWDAVNERLEMSDTW